MRHSNFRPRPSWAGPKNAEGDKCADYRCRSVASRYCRLDQKWYCLWCAQQINAEHNRKNEDGTVRHACISAAEATLQMLTGDTE